METVIIIAVILIWIIGAIVAYKNVFSKWENESKFNKVWYSIFWLPMLILHWVQQIYKKF